MPAQLTNFTLTFMDYFDSDEGRVYLRELFDEAIDNYLKENPGQTREQVLTRFKNLA